MKHFALFTLTALLLALLAALHAASLGIMKTRRTLAASRHSLSA